MFDDELMAEIDELVDDWIDKITSSANDDVTGVKQRVEVAMRKVWRKAKREVNYDYDSGVKDRLVQLFDKFSRELDEYDEWEFVGYELYENKKTIRATLSDYVDNQERVDAIIEEMGGLGAFKSIHSAAASGLSLMVDNTVAGIFYDAAQSAPDLVDSVNYID